MPNPAIPVLDKPVQNAATASHIHCQDERFTAKPWHKSAQAKD
jgi:hypothetical protein